MTKTVLQVKPRDRILFCSYGIGMKMEIAFMQHESGKVWYLRRMLQLLATTSEKMVFGNGRLTSIAGHRHPLLNGSAMAE